MKHTNKSLEKKQKIIWIVDHYSSEPKYGGISRQYDFACELGRRGYNVVVIASGFSHFTHEFIVPGDWNAKVSTVASNIHYVYLRTSSYKNNSGVGRACSMFSFVRAVLKYEAIIAQKYGKPDVVTGCSVHPLTWPAAWWIARKYKVDFIAEVRDFWPRIWIVSGEKKRRDLMVIFFAAIQNWTFKVADKIIYSMYHGDKYIVGELGIDSSKVYLIGQPMDCERFDANSRRIELLPDEIRTFLGINSSGNMMRSDYRNDEQEYKRPFICSFAGYYMTYEGVYVMLEALRILEQDRKLNNIRFIFVGSGQEKEGMKEFASRKRLQNVLIYDHIAKNAVPALISHSDICMAHLEIKGHKEVYKYGVSKNKVNEYLYSGACTLYGFLHKDDEVAVSGGGMMFKPYDAQDLADKIESIYNMPFTERKQFGLHGREYIMRTHSVQVLTDKLLEVLFG